MFADIKISTFAIFFDPLINCFARFDMCSSISCRRRKSLLEKSMDQLASELDTFTLLDKLNKTYNMVKVF
jgi:DNA-binding IscR family transcriptional regulator